MSSTPAEDTKKTYPLWIRWVGVVCALLTAWHMFATFLWIAPSNELRKAVPNDALRSYMLPMFGQSWSVFAPKPVDGDYSFEVRASTSEKAGGEYATEWVNASTKEMSMIHHNLFPPRAALAADHLASKYRTSWLKLNDEQKKAVELSYFKGDDWSERMDNRVTKLQTSNSKNSQRQTKEFLDLEERASAYATQIARATWGDEVKSVQFRVGRQGVVPFEQRNNKNAERPAKVTIESGWRGVTVMEGQSDERFAEIFNSLETVSN